MKKLAARMDNIRSTIIIHKHLDGADTIFDTTEGTFVDNPLGKIIGVVRRGAYKAVSKDIRWEYEPVSDFWPAIEPDSDCSADMSILEESKDQENLDYC